MEDMEDIQEDDQVEPSFEEPTASESQHGVGIIQGKTKLYPNMHSEIFGPKTIDMNVLFVDDSTQGSAEPPSYETIENGTTLRSGALFIQSDCLKHLDTDSVIKWAAVRAKELLGVEWIDDQSELGDDRVGLRLTMGSTRGLCLVFGSDEACTYALERLLRSEDSEDLAKSLQIAFQNLSDIYEEPTRHDLELISLPRRCIGFPSTLIKSGEPSPVWIRLARVTDRKKRGAGKTSQYYEKHGRQKYGRELEQETSLGKRLGGRKRSRPTEDAADVADLDAELDAYRAGIDTSSPKGGEWEGRSRKSRRTRDEGEGRRRIGDEEADRRRMAELDAELDAMVPRSLSAEPDVEDGNVEARFDLPGVEPTYLANENGKLVEGPFSKQDGRLRGWNDLTSFERGDFGDEDP